MLAQRPRVTGGLAAVFHTTYRWIKISYSYFTGVECGKSFIKMVYLE